MNKWEESRLSSGPLTFRHTQVHSTAKALGNPGPSSENRVMYIFKSYLTLMNKFQIFKLRLELFGQINMQHCDSI
jgi:hypothetical protein